MIDPADLLCDCGSGLAADRAHGSACDVCVEWPGQRVQARKAAMAPRGRPPQDGTKRDRSIRVMCHSEQEATWRLAAEAEGVDLSTWVRERLDEAAARDLETASRIGARREG